MLTNSIHRISAILHSAFPSKISGPSVTAATKPLPLPPAAEAEDSPAEIAALVAIFAFMILLATSGPHG